MGITGLLEYIRKTYPGAVKRQCKLGSLKGKAIGIDAMYFLISKLKSRKNIDTTEQWVLGEFLTLIIHFLRESVLPVFVFDGKHKIKEKTNTYLKRREARNKYRKKNEQTEMRRDAKVAEILVSSPNGHIKNIIQDLLTVNKLTIVDFGTVYFNNSNMTAEELAITTGLIREYEDICEELHKLKKNLSFLSHNFTEALQELLKRLGLTYYVSMKDKEADDILGELSRRGLIWGVLSHDSDMLVYGVKNLILNFNTKTNKLGPIFNLEELLTRMEFTMKEFMDLCVLLPNDYSEGVKNFKFKKIRAAMNSLGTTDFTTVLRKIVSNKQEFERIHGSCTDAYARFIGGYDIPCEPYIHKYNTISKEHVVKIRDKIRSINPSIFIRKVVKKIVQDVIPLIIKNQMIFGGPVSRGLNL